MKRKHWYLITALNRPGGEIVLRWPFCARDTDLAIEMADNLLRRHRAPGAVIVKGRRIKRSLFA
jgi:hypothetical protein